MEKKKSLKWYKGKEPPNKKNYDGNWEAKLLFKARSNTVEINSSLHRWKNVSKFCEKCMKKGIEIEETLEHLLVECDHYKEERKK